MEIKLDSLITKNRGEIRINISVNNHPDELWRRFAGVDMPRLIPQIGRAGHICQRYYHYEGCQIYIKKSIT